MNILRIILYILFIVISVNVNGSAQFKLGILRKNSYFYPKNNYEIEKFHFKKNLISKRKK